MVCKGEMNFTGGEKNGGKPRARFPPRCPVVQGEGPGKTALLYHSFGRGQEKARQVSAFRNSGE